MSPRELKIRDFFSKNNIDLNGYKIIDTANYTMFPGYSLPIMVGEMQITINKLCDIIYNDSRMLYIYEINEGSNGIRMRCALYYDRNKDRRMKSMKLIQCIKAK